MNRNISNIALSKQEYNLIVSYRKADSNFKNAVNRLLNLPEKIISLSKIKEFEECTR